MNSDKQRPSMSMYASAADYNAAMDEYLRTPSLHDAIMNLPCNVHTLGGLANDLERSLYKIGHRDARHAAAEMVAGVTSATKSDPKLNESDSSAARITELEEALRWAINKIDAETCTHEDTYRGGAIWTICRMCDMKWADDRGGFKAYREPKELTAARAALKEHT